MLEITIRSHKPGAPSTFQFENDALQTFLTEAHAESFDCQIIGLRALGSPLTVTGAPLKEPAKVAGPGTVRAQAPGINTPLPEQARANAQTQADRTAADRRNPVLPQPSATPSRTQPAADTRPVPGDPRPAAEATPAKPANPVKK